MSTNFERLKFIDDAIKCVVFGYINQSTKSLHVLIPIEIGNLCILYYHQAERFTKCGQDLLVSSSNSGDANMVKVVNVDTELDGRWQTAYGEIIIDGKNNPNMEYKWTFLLNASDNPSIDIVHDLKYDASEDYLDAHTDFYILSYDGTLETHKVIDYDGDLYPNNFKTGDVVTMIFNLKQKTLSFQKNKGEIKLGYKDIDMELQYRMAISIYTDTLNEYVELTNFECCSV